MAFSTLTWEEARQLYLRVIRGLIPEADTSEGSDYDIAARAAATLFTGNQGQAEHVSEQIFPSSADADGLERHREQRGIERQPAAGATGTTMLTASTGTDTQLSGSKLTHSDGTEYETTANATIDQPSWPDTKTIVEGSSTRRLFLSPGTSGIVADQVVEVNGEKRAVKSIISGASAIDLYAPLSAAPSDGDSITSARGAVAPIKSTGTGASTNKPVNVTLTLDSPVGNIDAATLIQDLGGGGDAETAEELRARVVDFDSVRPAAANLAQYRHWARQAPGVRVADAIIFPSVIHYGTINVFLIGVEGARVVSNVAQAAVKDYIESKSPYVDHLEVSEVSYDGTPVDVSIDVTPERGYEADWGTALAAGFTVSSVNMGSSSTTFAVTGGDPRDFMEIGDRFTFPLQVAGQWKLYHVRADGFTATEITTNEVFPVTPSTGIPLRPGGPLIDSLIGAIEGVFDSLGPGDKDAAGLRYVRHPSSAEAWDHSLQIATLTAAIMDLDGTDNVTVQQPATDQEPALGSRLRLGQLTIRTEVL